MIKLKLNEKPNKKIEPYFKVRHLNVPMRGMETYVDKKIKSEEEVISYLIGFFRLQNKIKNIKESEIRIEEFVKNSIEKPYTKYFYNIDNSNQSIQIILENENYKDFSNIANIKLEYVKYFDEYGQEYDVEVQKLSELLDNF